MSNEKEIRKKIIAIQNTQKITKAMELVSASKMKKLKKIMHSSSPYFKMISKIVKNITLSGLEYQHAYFENRNVKSIGYILISTEKGLCGSLNTNLFKKLLINMQYYKTHGIKIILSIIGNKGVSFFNSINIKSISNVINFKEIPKLSDLIGVMQVMIKEYENKKIDKLFIVTNKFINTISQIPTIKCILPISHKQQKNNIEKKIFWNYLYEPEAKELIHIILPRYIESYIYQHVIENLVSEQASRMIAMKNANDNAKNLIKNLLFIYNKTRQENITQELSEIISGYLTI